MKYTLRLAACLSMSLGLLGCGSSSTIKAKGKIVKGGQPFVIREGQGLRLIFAPQTVPEGKRYDSYAAEYHPDDGTFRVVGKDGQGLPPGKYTVSLELLQKKEDLLHGRLTGKDSPLSLEVVKGGDELVIDLDKVNFDSLLLDKGPAKDQGGRDRPRG